MILSRVDQPLQFIAWFLALIEFILALYILVLNTRHTANRHVSALLLLFAVNTLAVGLLVGATGTNEATLPTNLLAATTPTLMSGTLLVAVALLRPDWLRSRWRWIWRLGYGVTFLPILLTLVDVRLGTQLWFTGLDADSYTGGYVALKEYTAGSLSLLIKVLCFYVAPFAAIAPMLYVALRDRTAKPSTRRLAWLLLGVQIATATIQLVLSKWVGMQISTLISNLTLVLAYAYAGFQQMISGQHLQRERLQTRLTALILVVTIPVLIAVTVLVSAHLGAMIDEEATERLETTNHTLAANVSVWMESTERTLRNLVSLPDISSMDTVRQEAVLQVMAATYPHMYLISTTDLSGVNVARSDGALPQDYSDRPWFLQARDGASLTLQSLIGRTSGEPALVASMPIRDESGEIVGVGMIASDLTNMAHEVQVSRVGETGFSYVVDAQNQVVALPDAPFSTELRDLSTYPPVVALRQGKRGLVNFTDEQGQRWRAYVDELDRGWGSVVQQQEEELLSARQAFWRTSGMVVAIGVLMILVLAWLTIRQALRPIVTLTDTATSIAAGDLTCIAPVVSEDELGILARAFNSMTEQLRQLISGLEQRVAARTAELETANEQLEREVADKLRAEKQLQRYVTELEQSNKEIKQFAYVASHDLRAPLVNLEGFAVELRSALEVVDSAMNSSLPYLDVQQQQEVMAALQKDIPEALGFIESSASSMARFINALLKLSHLSRRKLRLEPIDMHILVRETLQPLAHLLDKHQAQVTFGPLPQVVADRISMEQILNIILSNAAKYLSPGRPGKIEITGEEDHEQTTLHVRDNGRGIAETDMSKVFAPFRQAGRQDTPGEGMGLAYVQTLVRRHGGRIWCESELGVGTTFTFTIPNHVNSGGSYV